MLFLASPQPSNMSKMSRETGPKTFSSILCVHRFSYWPLLRAAISVSEMDRNCHFECIEMVRRMINTKLRIEKNAMCRRLATSRHIQHSNISRNSEMANRHSGNRSLRPPVLRWLTKCIRLEYQSVHRHSIAFQFTNDATFLLHERKPTDNSSVGIEWNWWWFCLCCYIFCSGSSCSQWTFSKLLSSHFDHRCYCCAQCTRLSRVNIVSRGGNCSTIWHSSAFSSFLLGI